MLAWSTAVGVAWINSFLTALTVEDPGTKVPADSVAGEDFIPACPCSASSLWPHLVQRTDFPLITVLSL